MTTFFMAECASESGYQRTTSEFPGADESQLPGVISSEANTTDLGATDASRAKDGRQFLCLRS
jgi:hypothetical protein